MMIDNTLMEIMSTKPNKVYQEWLQGKKNNTLAFDLPKDEFDKKKFLLDKKNLSISKTIDRLNEKIRGV